VEGEMPCAETSYALDVQRLVDKHVESECLGNEEVENEVGGAEWRAAAAVDPPLPEINTL
jgi:hypothetical protein